MAWLFHRDYLGPVVKWVGTIYGDIIYGEAEKSLGGQFKNPAQKGIYKIANEGILVLRDTGADGRLRVLVIGPANAGKTTLLERLSDSAGAAIVTRDGKRVIFLGVQVQLKPRSNLHSLRSRTSPEDMIK
jgi:hypothetical protein